MQEKSYSLIQTSNETFPKVIGKPVFDKLGTTCIIRVKLEKGKTYAMQVNNNRFNGFRDLKDKPAMPYLITFATKP